MRKFEVALNEARRNYETVSWRPDVGRTPQAAAYEKATLDYENAQAAYDEATAPAKLSDLRAGPNANDLESAQIAVKKAYLDVEDVAAQLAATRLLAPVDGAVLSINPTVGQRVGSGASAITLARRDDLELEVNVAEVDVSKIALAQPVEIALDALPGETFAGDIISIAPAAESQSGVVNYPVTIRLTHPDERALAGMTAVATIVNETAGAGWLVPANALRQGVNGSQVMVLRDGAPTPVQVTVGARQGEWIVVDSPAIAGRRPMAAVSMCAPVPESISRWSPRPGTAAPTRL